MASGTRSSWSRRARAFLFVGIVWAEPWTPARAAPQNPDGGVAPSLLAIPVPRPPSPNEGEYVLGPAAGGGYVFDDYRFDARIARDGHVTFQDKPVRLETRVFGVLTQKYRRTGDRRPAVVQAIEQVVRDDPERPISPMVDVCEERVDMMLPGLASCIGTKTPIRIRGTFAHKDELMFLTGRGWYRHEKAKFLSATFDFRVRLAAKSRTTLLREAVADLPDRLDALWDDAGFTPRERRRIVCLLWAEVNVDQPDTRKAADVITSWIRRRLPAGSTDAYSAPELAACAASGNRPFAPYDQ
jgi:hypothetical protein